MKKALYFLLIVLSVFLLTGCERNNTDINVYTQYAENDRYLPTLDELGEYTSVEALYHHDSELFFVWEAYHLIVSYDKPQYEKEKASLEKRYTFHDKVVYEDGFYEDHIADQEFYDEAFGNEGSDVIFRTFPPYCDIDGYHLRIMETEGIGFPRDVYFVGTNDEKHRLIYIRFYDSDLDSVESLKSFLTDECGWSVLIEKDLL